MNVLAVVILLVIIILSTNCNVIAISYIFRKKKHLKDKIVFVLCTTNLCQALGGYTIELYSAITGQIKDTECQIQAFIVCFCTYSALGFYISLTIEKYIKILYPFQSDRLLKGKFLSASLLFSPLLVGLLLGTPPLIGWGKYGKSLNDSHYCSYVFDHDGGKSFFVTATVCGVGVPVIFASICFARIIGELRHTTSKYKRRYGKSSTISIESNKRTHEQEIHSLITGFVYFASWAPYCVVLFLLSYRKHVPKALEYFSICMCKSSTVSSAVLFCLIEKRARQYIKGKASKTLFELAVLPSKEYYLSPRPSFIEKEQSTCLSNDC